MYVFYGAQCLHRKILVETSSGDGVPESSIRVDGVTVWRCWTGIAEHGEKI